MPQTNDHVITVLPGDGIGPEVMSATVRVLKATSVPLTLDMRCIGEEAQKRFGVGLPDETIGSIWRNKLAIKGPTGTPQGAGHRSFNVALRETFGLYANIRPLKSLPGVVSHFSGIDVVLFRENLEDLYVGEERKVPGGAEAIARFTAAGSERIAMAAFEYAHDHGRKKVTVAVKDNILKLTHGKIFYEKARSIAASFPDIQFEHLIADNFAMQFVKDPARFDVVLLPNFLGDIFSDMAAGVTHGSLGFAAGLNKGMGVAIAEAVHGTAPDIAGRGIANPSASILSGALLLEHIGETVAAGRVRTAIERTLGDNIHTGDVARESVGTAAFTDAVIARL